VFPVGTTTVHVSATDFAGNPVSGSFTVTVTPVVFYAVLAAKGEAVPAQAGIPAGAVWSKLGVPGIRRDGDEVAWLGQWAGGAGVFVDGALVAKKGDAAPDAGGAVFAAFKDPALDDSEEAVFLAGLSGAGVTSANKKALYFGAPGGPLALVVRAGGPAPLIPGAVLKTIASHTVSGGAVFFSGKLLVGTGGVTTADDDALWVWAAGGTTLLAREGADLGSVFGQNVKALVALKAGSGTPGHGRSTAAGATWARVTLADGSQRLVRYTTGGTALVAQESGPGGAFGPLGGVYPLSFGLPAVGVAGSGTAAFLAKLAGPGVSSANDLGVFALDPEALPFRKGDAAPGLSGVTLAAFKDPVLNSAGHVAALATLAGSGIGSANKSAIVWSHGTPTIAARTGDAAPGAGGAVFKAFKSVALPDGLGPVFVATLSGAPAGATSGVWAVDSDGLLRLLLRAGDPVAGGVVKSFKVLGAVSGSGDQRRAFNQSRALVALVSYTDGTQRLVRITAP
jgi:hypothetical protein